MSNYEEQYYNLLKTILTKGDEKSSQKSTTDGTISYFGYQLKYNLQDGFPAPITKKLYWKSVVNELLWFLSGNVKLSKIIDKTGIWNDDAYNWFKRKKGNLGKNNFINAIKIGNIDGGMGKIYGYQWRKFNGEKDQIVDVINNLINKPESRRHIVTAWNPAQLDQMALPPCHMFYQFNVVKEKSFIDLQFYLRSNDVFLGLPFNIASYALLLEMVAKLTNYTPRYLTVSIGDAHIYDNQLDAVYEQIDRYTEYFAKESKWQNVKLPKLKFSDNFKKGIENIKDYETYFDNVLDNFDENDFKLENYVHMKPIKAPLNT